MFQAVCIRGCPSSSPESLIVKEGFVASANFRTRCPDWVAEVLTSESLTGPADRSLSSFGREKSLPKEFSPRLGDYARRLE
jgi:DNA/RNA endonuclease G (NUC1)